MKMEDLDTIFKLCKLSLWEWDLSKNYLKMDGFFGTFKGTLNSFLKKIHPIDRRNFKKTIPKFITEQILFEKFFRIQLNPDTSKWVFMRGDTHPQSKNTMHGIMMGINAWKKNQDEQYTQQQQLLELSQHNSRGEIISLLAHELTQPLTVISTYASGCIYRLQERKINNTQLIDTINQIKQNAALIGCRIHELKDFFNQAQFDYSEENIHSVIHESTSLLTYDLQAQGISMKYKFQNNLPEVKINRKQIKQVLYTLIKNSIDNISTIAKCITIKTKKINNYSIKITIVDNNNFNKHNLYNNDLSMAMNNNYERLQMKLTMCRTIIEAHGGTLVYQSSTFGNHYQFSLHS